MSMRLKLLTDQEKDFFYANSKNFNLTDESARTIRRYIIEQVTQEQNRVPDTHIAERLVTEAIKFKNIIEDYFKDGFNDHLMNFLRENGVDVDLNMLRVKEYTLLYNFVDLLGINKILTLENFQQMTGMLPSRFYSYMYSSKNAPVERGLCFKSISHENYIKYSNVNRKINPNFMLENIDFFPLLDKPLERGNFYFNLGNLTTVPEAVFLNVKAYDTFILKNAFCVNWDIGDKQTLHIKHLKLINNFRLEALPNVEYRDIQDVYIKNCPALTNLPDDWYNNPALTIKIKNCPNLILKEEYECVIERQWEII